MLFDNFVSTVFVYSLHDKFSSVITLRNVVYENCSMFVPFKAMFTSDLCCFLFANIITFVLFTLSDNLITLNRRSNCLVHY